MISYKRQIYRAIQSSGLDEERNKNLRGCWWRTAIQQRGYHDSLTFGHATAYVASLSSDTIVWLR
jgi:hypothetical protein